MIDFVFDFGFYTLILYIVEKHLQLFVKQEQVHVSRMVMVSVWCYLQQIRCTEVCRGAAPGRELRS